MMARLMKDMGLEGVIRGKKPKTTIQDKSQPCPSDKVNRQFKAPAPNVLWVSDVTYVATWQGFVYVAFVIDAFARRIVGWRVSRTAPCGGRPERTGTGRSSASTRGWFGAAFGPWIAVSVHSLRTQLAEAGIEPSVGSLGECYDNALAETINGLFKAKVIHRNGPWRSFDAVEYTTLEWADRFNSRRLLEPIGSIPPAQAEANFYAALERSDMAAWLRQISLPQTRHGSMLPDLVSRFPRKET